LAEILIPKTASPKHPVLNTPAQMRRAAGLLLPASSGAPLVKSTPTLEVVKIWMDGTMSCEVEMIATPDSAAKFLPGFLLDAFSRLVRWKEAQGYQLAMWQPGLKPPKGEKYKWAPMSGGRFWACGPFEALVFKMRQVPEVDPRTGRRKMVDVANRQTTGEDRLNETGGMVAYRVASYFTVRQHLAEVPVRKPQRRRQ